MKSRMWAAIDSLNAEDGDSDQQKWALVAALPWQGRIAQTLNDDAESSLGGTTDPEASKNRRAGLCKDENGPNEDTPANREG